MRLKIKREKNLQSTGMNAMGRHLLGSDKSPFFGNMEKTVSDQQLANQILLSAMSDLEMRAVVREVRQARAAAFQKESSLSARLPALR